MANGSFQASAAVITATSAKSWAEPLWVPFTMFVGGLCAGLGLLVGGRKSAAA